MCRDHLLEDVERKVRRELRLVGPPVKGTIAVGVSGGKDSAVLLHLLSSILADRRDTRIVGICVDEGIPGYRDVSLGHVRELTERLGVEFQVVAFKDLFDRTVMGELEAGPGGNPCGFCGVLRRTALNRAARDAGADLLAVGHNLDDTAQSVLMNICKGDDQRLARMPPHVSVREGLIPRITPLVMVPEQETTLYAMLAGLPFHDGECPGAETAERGVFRDMLYDLEEKSPGTRHSLVAFQRKVAPAIRDHGPSVEMGVCHDCGEPSLGEICRVCQMLGR